MGRREILLNALGEGIDGRGVGKLTEFVIELGLLDVEAFADCPEELERLGCLLLGEQIDLEIEVIAGIAALLHAVLLHENEGAEENALYRDDHGQEDERIRIEAAAEREDAGVDEEPQGEDGGVNGNEPEAAGEASDEIGEEVGEGATPFEVALQLCDGLDVCTYGVGGWHSTLDA